MEMEIKRLIGSGPIPDNQMGETPTAPEINSGISGVSDAWENSTSQNNALQEMTQMPAVVAQQALSNSTEQIELLKLLEQNRFGQIGSPNIRTKSNAPLSPNLVNTNPTAQPANVKYPDAILNLAQVLHKSPAELVALFKKYGLDPANLPDPPNRQVAELFNDPAFDPTLTKMKSKLQSSYQDYKNEIAFQTSKANSINASNLASDKSVTDDLNTAPFEYLYNAKNGANTPEGQAWIQQREMVGDRVTKLLSAMYPGAAVKSNPSNGDWGNTSDPSSLPGFIEFNGQPFNAVPNSSSGEIRFGNEGAKVDYPDVQLVTWEYDSNGAGAVPIPDWMQQANYPTHAYDTPWNEV
jgi:hypothetical protein